MELTCGWAPPGVLRYWPEDVLLVASDAGIEDARAEESRYQEGGDDTCGEVNA